MALIDVASGADVRVVNLGRLALLWPLLKKLNVAAIIDRHLPCEADISHGTALAVLLAARLDSPTALVNVAGWAAEHGVEYLWDAPPEKLNDDRLARALDALFEKRHAILAEITHEALRLTGLTLANCHFDTTHLVLYGSYDRSTPRPPHDLERLLDDLRMSPAHISRGYLTRYKMLQLGLTAVVDDLGAVPVACHLFDGNRNGHTGIKEQYHLLRNFLQLPEDFLLVSDRGTCSVEHLATLRRHGHYAICAAPWQDYGPLFEQHRQRLLWKKASYLSLEQRRRREASSLPREEYHLAVLNHSLTDPATKEPFSCRLIFVHSSAADKEAKERREKNIACIQAGLANLAEKLERAHPTTTPESVARQIAKLLGKRSAAQHFRWQIVPLTAAEQAALPPPRKGFRRQTHRLEYSLDAASALAESRHDGIYVLLTTAPLSQSGDVLFSEYKRQTHVERSHHELKTPLAVTPIFLKTPRRVESLASLLFVALQAYMTLERLYRQSVPPGAPTLERRMTAERILKKFNAYGITVRTHAGDDLLGATGLTLEQRRILNQLSFVSPAKILRRIHATASAP